MSEDNDEVGNHQGAPSRGSALFVLVEVKKNILEMYAEIRAAEKAEATTEKLVAENELLKRRLGELQHALWQRHSTDACPFVKSAAERWLKVIEWDYAILSSRGKAEEASDGDEMS